ncbi:UDP-galactose:beta-d-galactoside beta-1,4-galactosyltransferase [Plakobranchus ocellatus]|uniref:Glycosyltransferase family 92 protein n=1 Tax=Plakobranchus ocellatus TaxID=259542 RepID=A0AAV3Y0L8_9GAST|nr:UDP-galactose:beta-d-galactoside beta-1,4-galactosyltransferase [Plakobranchus ocellatus]
MPKGKRKPCIIIPCLDVEGQHDPNQSQSCETLMPGCDVWRHLMKNKEKLNVTELPTITDTTVLLVHASNHNETIGRINITAKDASEQKVEKLTNVLPLGKPKNFELVAGLSSKLYVYGALWQADRRLVRLISIKVQNYNFRNLLCVLYYSSLKNQAGVYVKPVVKELHTYKSPYTSASVSCPVKQENGNEVPLFVGLVESQTATPKRIFVVENRVRDDSFDVKQADYVIETPKRQVKVDFTVCIPALHGMDNAVQVMEKLEMNRLLGAGRVVLYNNSINATVDALLRMYAKEFAEGRESLEVIVLPWKLPIENEKVISIPYFAQQLAIDDCMYRYKRLSTYMIFNDLDELLIPLRHANWSGLVAERRKLKPQSIGWLFRCTVMNKDRPSPGTGFEEDALRYGSAVLGLTMRDQYVFPPSDRPKLLVDPRDIEEMGVHLIWSGKGTTDNLPVDVGLLFHYRVPINSCTPQIKDTRVVDKFGKRLVPRLKDIWSKMKDVPLKIKPFVTGDKSTCT